MNLKELREKLGALRGEIDTLGKKESLDATEQKRFDEAVAESKTLRERIKRMETAIELGNELDAPAPTRAVELGKEDRGGPPDPTPEPAKPKRALIPYAGREIRHFKAGENHRGEKQSAAERAFASGMWLLSRIRGINHPNPNLNRMAERAAGWWQEYGGNYVDREERAMGETANPLGGYLVPDVFGTTIIDLREIYGVFRQRARRVPMTSDTFSVPRRTGGLTVYVVGDNSEITASDKGWDRVSLTARTVGCLAKWSSELNEDGVISMADDLASEIGYAFALFEDQCGFLGDGTSTYAGISGLITQCAAATATVVTAATANTAFATLDLTDFESMLGKLPQYAAQASDVAWYISRAGWAASMMRLADAAGGNTTMNIEGGVGMSFLGYPVILSQVMNSTLTAQTSTNGLCYFGSLQQAASLGDRRGVSTAVSTERYFEFDQFAVRGTERFDINVHDVGDTSVAGSMVMLATPGS